MNDHHGSHDSDIQPVTGVTEAQRAAEHINRRQTDNQAGVRAGWRAGRQAAGKQMQQDRHSDILREGKRQTDPSDRE